MALCRRSLIFLVAFVFLSRLYGQPHSNKEEITEFRVIALADFATLFYDINGEKEIIDVGLGTFSQLYPASADRKLVFYREEQNPDPSLPPIKVPIAKATLPGSEGPFLVLLLDTPSSEGLEHSTAVIKHSLNAHPANTYRVFNFSKRRMAVRLADKDMLLSRGESDTVAFPNTRKAWLKVAADNKDSGWLVVTSSSHNVGSDARTTVFIVDIPASKRDPNPKGVVVRRMRERITTNEFGEQYVR